MFIDAFVEKAARRLSEKRDEYTKQLLKGSIGNMEDYRFYIGKLHSLNDCIDTIRELYKEIYDVKDLSSGRNFNEYDT